MQQILNPRKLSILNFAKMQTHLEGAESLAQLDRLCGLQQAGAPEGKVSFKAQGQMRASGTGPVAPWLQLQASVRLSLLCQRCLEPVEEEVTFEREFRFVESEAVAAAQDEVSVEDVLVLSADFDLLELVEDELLMAFPASPKHVTCPHPVKLKVADPDFQELEDKPNPFAALTAWKLPKT